MKTSKIAIRLGWLMWMVVAGSALAQSSDGMEWKRAGKKFAPSAFLTNLVAGTRHEHVMMPMRDGAKMATEIFLPPETEKGPWPVVLLRTPYGRGNVDGYAKWYADAAVVQWTGGDDRRQRQRHVCAHGVSVKSSSFGGGVSR